MLGSGREMKQETRLLTVPLKGSLRRLGRRRRHRWRTGARGGSRPQGDAFLWRDEEGREGRGAAGPPASSMTRMQRAVSSFLNLGLSPCSNGGHLGKKLGYITCL